MITSSRLAHPVASKLEQEQSRTRLNGFDLQDSSGLPTDSLLSGGYLLNARNDAGGGNTFDQLLQLAKAQPEKPTEKADSNQNKIKDDDKKLSQSDKDKRDTAPEKNEKVTSKNKRSHSDKDTEQSKQADTAELAQLLAAQPQRLQSSETAKSHEQTHKQDRGMEKRQAATLGSKVNDLNQAKGLQLDQPKTLDDTISNLTKKVNALGVEQQTTAREMQQDELGKLASKFDSVQMEFSGDAGNAQANVTQAQLQKSLQNKEALLEMMQQENLESDRAFNDFLKHTASQNAMIDGHTMDRLEALNQMKSAQLEKLNPQELRQDAPLAQQQMKELRQDALLTQQQMKELRQDALLAQQQMKELQAGQQSQWKTLDELSPDQLAMMDSLSGMNNGSATEKMLGFTQTLPQSVQARLTTQEQQGSKPMDATPGTVDPHALFSTLKGEGNTSGGFSQNGSSFAGNSSRNEIGQVASPSNARIEESDFASPDKAPQAKADARTRESERTREMARSAAQRAQTIATELAAKGGGTARVQIKDSQLGVVELRINMSDNNRMNVELVANSDRIKVELEKHAEALKDGLEKHKLVVDGVQFATDVKLGESAFQNSTQSDSQNQQQPSQQGQQSFNSFAQNNSGQGQGGFEQERFFEPQQLAGIANQKPQINARQSYTGKNDSQTNIQRNANGSLKVTA